MSSVRCDGCGDPSMEGDDAREARRLASLDGYVREGGKDYCSRCKVLPAGQRPWDLDPPIVYEDAAP
jgi:hypothetical protein